MDVAGASQHTNNTARLSGIIESLHFLSLLGSVPRASHACISYDPRHAANVCLGSVQSRTNVRLGVTCQKLLLQVHASVSHCATHTAMEGMWAITVLTTLPLLEFLAWFPARMLSHVGLHPCHNTTELVRSCSDPVEIQHRLGDARGGTHTTAAGACLAVTL